MGSQSSKSSQPSVVTYESEKSARNVLENLAKDIKGKVSNDAKMKGSSLKGNLRKAKFYHPFSEYRRNYRNSCELDYKFHTNVWNQTASERDPCYRRQPKNNSKLEGAVCTNSKIKGNENKINDTGACAPYRRRNICDYNIEHIHEGNVLTTDDLLGNVLVMAKGEGESIVNSNAHNGMLNVCTLLARSFADIGDILRGKDLFLGNNESEKIKKEELQGNLEKIFYKFKAKYEDLKNLPIDDIREYWWALNRKDVWKALTCSAPNNAQYFIKSSRHDQSFSDEHCGHNKNDDPLTNLDYVPQFLRWFEEWAEHFCLVRKHKLEKVKEACRGKDDKKYCSVDGYDCKRTDREKNTFYVDLECPDCEKECRSYKKWIENQEKEFYKQKNKYDNETNNVESKSFNVYDETFYNNLRTNYSLVENFLETLKEGSQCKRSDAKQEIDFIKPERIFSSSEYCKACPLFGLKCVKKNKCIPKSENDENNRIGVDKEHTIGVSTEIPILLNDDTTNSIDYDLETCSKKYSLFKGIRKQEWKCQYLNGVDHCIINNIENHVDVDKKIKFKEFFERWLKYFIQDYNKYKNPIERCIRNKHPNENLCIKGCKNKCECVEIWLKKKSKEWESIKNYYNQNSLYQYGVPYWVNRILTQKYFSSDFINALESTSNINGLEKLKQCSNETCKIEIIKGINDDFIRKLISKLEEKNNKCISQNDDNKGQKCCIDMPKSPNEDDDEDEEEDEDEPPSTSTSPRTSNPCVESSGVHITKTVTDVVKILHRKEKYRRSHISKLKAHAENGTYNRSGSAENFKGDKLCNINENHSNAEKRSLNPCNGKNTERFTIGQDWSHANEKNTTTYSDVYLPQRREHMCTSNLEYLQTNRRPFNGSDGKLVNNSFLGDVLLAAKFEAEKIKELYKTANDEQSVCRAVSRSFADIGDIIKGTDMWDNDSGSKDIEKRMQTVFKNIKEKHDGIKDNPKYTDKVKFLDLRSDWWKANRTKIWEAMQCAIKDFNTSGGYCQYKRCDRVPVDDYIPQRLRWMTEWAEWFCKMQKEEYNKLVRGCTQCKNKGGGKQCMNDDNECKTCKEACAKYKAKIETWKKQWEKISNIYKILYKIAEINAGFGAPSSYSAYAKDNHVIEFLQKLHTQNGGAKRGKSDTVYSTAEGYVHQEAIMNCEKQHVFCEKKNGVKPSNGKEDNEYVFRNYPNGYDDACICENNKKPVPGPKKKEEEAACEIVKRILRGKTENNIIGNCKGKYKNGITSYPGWNCDTEIHTKHIGACMPPRRQKLCIHFLAHPNQIKHLNKQEHLRNAFIKCAAAEIFFSWYKHKNDNNTVTNLQNQLKDGRIPEEFKRQMFYTFGDYRDFLFGTDISKKHGEESDLEKKINSLFQNSGGKNPGDLSRDNWWKEHSKELWEVMLCVLEHFGGSKEELVKNYNYETVKFNGDKMSLEEFAQRPQFLRWMTEWGEEFCKKQQKHYMDLVQGCTGCTVGENGTVTTDDCKNNCNECKVKCKAYEAFITQWKVQWEKQRDKYTELYEKTKRDNKPHTDQIEKSVFDYLKTLSSNGTTYDTAGKYIKQEGYINDCQESQQNNFDEINNDVSKKNYAFREYPHKYKDQCLCTDKSAPEALPPPPPHADDTPQVDVCKIVEEILTGEGNLNKACTQKYSGNQSRLGWKCVTSGDGTSTGGSNGAICIPPRRRKLYIHELPDDSTITDAKALSKWFIESAAVETFFLWHKFKKEWELRRAGATGLVGATGLAAELGLSSDDEDKDPQKKLEEGEIPEEFKRQMFYTLGDYSDICIGVKDDVVEVLKASDIDITTINEKIKTIINGGNNQSGGVPPNNDKDPKTWWNKHAEAIWNGMVCALTYTNDTSGAKGENAKIEQNSDLKNALWDDKTKKPKKNGTHNYTYDGVKLDNSGDGRKTNDHETSTLTSFTSRPTYFRWLEEWGEQFCRERQKRLEKIEEECRGGETYTGRYSSGDGEDCTQMLGDDHDTVHSFEYPDCGKHCSSYRKWIERKKEEFSKQKEEYSKQKTGAEGYNHGNEFSKTLQSLPEAKDFLERLKNGPCSKTNNESGKDDINFNKDSETFKHTQYCDPCPIFGVQSKTSGWSDVQEKKCKDKTDITAKDIETMGNFTQEVTMLVSDNSTTEFKGNLEACQDKCIFEGITKDEWKCGKLCNSVICFLQKNKNDIDLKQYIQIRALFKRWVETFLDDYNKIKHKISHCTKNDKEIKCINGCDKKCTCVEQWIKLKKGEWDIVKNIFLDQYKSDNSDEYFNVRSFLETLIPQIDVANAKENIIKLSQFDNSCGCSVKASSEKKKIGNEKDAIECMLKKLEDKIEECKNKNSHKPQQPCENPPPVGYDEPLEETEVKTPNICPEQQQKPEEEPDGTCDAHHPEPDVKEEEEEKEEEKDKGDEEADSGQEDEPEERAEDKVPLPPSPSPRPSGDKEAKPDKKVSKPKRRTRMPRQVESPHLQNALLSSTIMWSVGIGFAAISYFFLKKKSKSSVDLLRVLNISKGEYEMPTFKSKNRYIPYRSGSYKGKTYIYMEGDTSGDEDKYIWDLSSSDITSSESEYEEMDINDIYVPGSPKYKTLIEVVLEPSKSNGNTLGDDMVPTTNTFTDDEWNELKHDFISQYLPNTEPNTLYFDKPEEKPFITSIHDRDLYTGEEISYNINMVNNDIPMSDKNDVYSGIDLINDALSGEPIDIYDEVLKRKENELFGTKHPKRTSNNSVIKSTSSDPIDNQLNLFHTWLDRHRDMCEQWNNKEDILNKLNEEWNKDNDRGNVPIDNKTLNTDVSIQIDMDHGKPKKEFPNMDTYPENSTMDSILEDLEKYNKPYYDVQDDIYYDVNDHDTSTVDTNNMDVPSKVQIEMDVNSKLVKEKYPISDVWDI
ncbi:erythrocyte membrane protein 1, PfEMP1, putative [Plasmodium sp.]|nr:erythrocyte membrane protein 1, PfEMP1, putative [Plasmodium sp.]